MSGWRFGERLFLANYGLDRIILYMAQSDLGSTGARETTRKVIETIF